ncbi:MAG: sensor domain-containing diguanylate cyclase [Acholeplasmataceae bacterium]
MDYIIAIIASAFVTNTLVILLTYTYLKIDIKIKGVKRWIIGVLLYLIGVTFLMFTNQDTYLYLFPLASLSVMLGFLFFTDGIYGFTNEKSPLKLNAIIVLILIILTSYFIYFELQENLAFLIPSLFLSYMSFQAAFILIKHRYYKENRTITVLSLFFISLFLIASILCINSFFPDPNIYNKFLVNNITIYTLSLFLGVFIFLSIYLNVLIYEIALNHSSNQLLKFKKLFDHSPLSHIIVDQKSGRIIDFNNQFLNLVGFKRDDLINKELNECVPFKESRLKSYFENNDLHNFNNVQHIIFDNTGKKLDVITSAALIEEQPLRKILLSITNVSEIIELQEQLTFYANHDFLTKLPNRRYLVEYLKKLVNEKREFAFIAVDLNKFKKINDTHGHYYGDKTLEELAIRFKNIPEVEFATRLGGDEFVLITPYENTDKLLNKINEIINIIEKPFIINRKNIEITASIGYSLYPNHGATFKDLMQRADKNMYQIKKER